MICEQTFGVAELCGAQLVYASTEYILQISTDPEICQQCSDFALLTTLRLFTCSDPLGSYAGLNFR
jgi:hypothetical protein